jgi:hypothetical protein
MLDILIPIGFFLFILFILNKYLGWWPLLKKILNFLKVKIHKWSR